MKRQINHLRLMMLLFALMSSAFANAQIEIGDYNKKRQFILEKSYFPDPQLFGRTQMLTNLNEILKNVKLMSGVTVSAVENCWVGTALNDKISAKNGGTLFYYTDIVGEGKIKVYPSNEYWGVNIPVSKVCGKPDNSVSFYFPARDEALKFAEYLYFLSDEMYSKNPKIMHINDSIAKVDSIQFSIQLAKYKEMPEKPAITEEQRKYIVQANAMNEEKDYISAIDYYNKAININPVAYPAGYYNLALLYAQITNFKSAISNMKKYLMLVPYAEDARKAQDKIYEWEAKLDK